MKQVGSTRRIELITVAVVTALAASAASLVFQSRLKPPAEAAKPARAEAREEAPATTARDFAPVVWESPAPPPAPAASASSEPVEHERHTAAATETADDVVVRLENTFQTDARTSTNLRRAESTLRAAFSHEDGVKLQTLECRSRTCRAEVTFSSAELDAHITRKVFVNPDTMVDLNMEITIPIRTQHQDGSVAATMYFVAPDPNAATGG